MGNARLNKSLLHDDGGNSLVELAIYLPLALMLFAGMVDFSLAVSQKLQAQQGVARTLEMAANVGIADLSEASLRAEAARAANVPEDRVNARIWLECDGVITALDATGCTTSDALARYASVTVENTYDLSFYSRMANIVRPDALPVFQVQGSVRIQ
jgi:Flp pilus assembly protein TadG